MKRAVRGMIHELIEPYRVQRGKGFRLSNIDPGDRAGLKSKARAEAALRAGVELLAEYQEKLYAQDRWAVLLIFQAMDAAGKDGVIKHVMSGVNPQGCEVYPFKAPTATELDHDYLWRCHVRVPERGRIGIFNRSYYEETLVVRVHRELLEAQKLPRGLVSDRIWEQRYEDINAFECYLARNGVLIRKFFLHVSREEQGRRLLERIERPEKNWKFSMADLDERDLWDRYMEAYEETIRATATPHAPWIVVPADHKWFARLVVAATIVKALDSLDLSFPKLDTRMKAALAEARARLEAG